MHPVARRFHPILQVGTLTLALALLATTVRAHPISLSAVAVNVRADRALAHVRIMLEDLVLYHRLEAGPEQRFAADTLRQAADKHQQFLLQYFTVRDADGQLLHGEVLRIDLADIPESGVPPAELMARNVSYHMAFPLPQRPEFLTFTQTFGGAQATLPAIMELVVFHHDALLQRPIQLPQGRPYTVRFDWAQPPTNTSQNMQAYQEHKQEEFRRQLGITSYSGVYSFIYITDQEIRHEVLMPLLTLEKWLPLERAAAEFFEVADQETARDRLAAFFRTQNPVEIDGVAVTPEVTRLQFFGLDINDFAQQAPPRRLSMYQARLGVILSYPVTTAPTQVRMTWELFNAYAPFVRSVVYVHDHEPRLHTFEPRQPPFLWTRQAPVSQRTLLSLPRPVRAPFWSLPVLSLGAWFTAVLWLGMALRQRHRPSRPRCLGVSAALLILGALCWPVGRLELRAPLAARPHLADPEARALSLGLLQHVYGAFASRHDGEVYDALAQSVDERLLEQLYLQIHKGLQMQEQGGAVARVQEVALVEQRLLTAHTQANGLPQVAVQCRWQVTGTVEHWGHIHTRVNEYEAILTLRAAQETWKIAAYEVLNERPVRVETGLRTVQRAG